MSRLGPRLGALFGMATLGVACGPATVQPDARAGTDADARPPVVFPRGIDEAPYIDVQRTASPCSAPQGIAYEPGSASEVVSLLVGRWQRCSGAFADGVAFDGLELDADRRWLVLRQNEGVLEAETGPDTEAVWFLEAEENPAGGSVDNLDLLFVQPTTMVGPVTYALSFFQNPTGFELAGAMTFTWLGD